MRKMIVAATMLFAYSLGRANAQAVLFDFDSAPYRASLPIDLTAGGINAHFTANPLYYNYSIQQAGTLGFTPAGFSGLCIYPNTIYACDLIISFDRALSDVAILYAPQELALDTSCTMRITGYYGSKFVATATHSLSPDGNTSWPSDVLSLSATQPFTSVVIHYDKPPPGVQENYGTIFMADNLVVTPWSAPYARVDSLTKMANGHTMLQGVSVPLATVTIEETTTLTQPFAYLATVSVASDGSFQFEDSDALPMRFYRVVYP
ncbi:MAG: hypothetical protein ACXWHF_02300 [Chthoniobacterales bacterium]